MVTRKKTYSKKLELSDFDLGWLVGMIEGEGNMACMIGKKKYGSYLGTTISISSTDKDIIDRLEKLIPSGRTAYKREPKVAHHKTQYVWNVNKRQEVRSITETILPYLSDRRKEQFGNALQTIIEYENG